MKLSHIVHHIIHHFGAL